MGQIYLQDKDGLTQGFTIKGDTPSPTEQIRINNALNGTPAPQAPVDNTGIMSAFASGVGAGWNQTQAGFEGLASLAAGNMPGGTFGGMTVDEWNALRQQDKQEGSQYYAPQGGLEDQAGLYGKSRFLAYQLGQSLPATTGGIIGAAAGSALGPAGTVGGFIAGSGGAALASVPQNYEQNLEAQEQEHGRITNPNKALIGAVGQSALEGLAERATLGVAGIVGGAVPDAAKSLIQNAARGAWTKAAAKVGESTLTGMSTEAVTGVMQQAIQRWQADKPLGGAEAQQEYLENAMVGGLLGGVTGGAFGTAGAALDLRENAKLKRIQTDLEEQDNVGDYRQQNSAARTARANAAVDLEDNLRGANAPLLQDLRPEQDLLSGPNAVTRPPSADTTAPVGTDQPSTTEPTEGKITPQSAPAQDTTSKPKFSEQEYTDAVTAMRGEKLVSPDKIKNSMNIGRNKAQAIFDAMLDRTDARKAGSNDQYLTVVDDAKAGVSDNTQSENIKRSYGVQQIPNEEQTPFQVRRASDTKIIGPSFKTADEAFNFADSHPNLGDYSVVQNPTPSQYGVYETTSGVQGNKPTSRLVKSFDTNEDARNYANNLNPQFSPETNDVLSQEPLRNGIMPNERDARVAQKMADEINRYRNNLQSVADQILGPGRTTVDLADALNAPDGSGLDTGHVIEGMVDNDPNSALQRLRVAYDIFQPGMSPDQMQSAINSVGHHEFVHIMKGAGLFTPDEWTSLVKRANATVPGKDYTYLERAQVRTKGAPEGAGLDEEAVAEMVRDYMRDPSKFDTDTRGLFRRMFDFVRTLGGYARDVMKGNNVLSDIASGKIGERPSTPERAKMYGNYYSSVKIPGFYLKSADFFEKEAERNPDQSYPGNQWLGMLNPSKTGIKDEELKWLGLKDWLKDQKKVSVKDILQYIGANSLDVNETIFDNSPNNQDRRTATFHGETTQMGGSDYTELLFHMPHAQPQFSVDAHFDGFPNVIATGRFKTRTIDGKKTLFIEEMQSDLHQQGRSKGYVSQSDMDNMKKLNDQMYALGQEYRSAPLEERSDILRQYNQAREQYNALGEISNIPEAPFKTNWHELVVKRLVKHAVDTGHESISWNAEPDGVAQTEKYGDLFESKDQQGNPTYETQYGNNVTGIVNFYTNRLAKDITKLFNKPDYGNAAPKIVPRVETSGADLNLEELFPTPDDFHMVMQEIGNIEPDMRRFTNKATQIVRSQRNFDPMEAMNKSGMPLGRFADVFNEAFPEYAIDNATTATIDKHGNPNVARWQMDITPELKATAEGKGFPLFSSVQKSTAPDTNEFRHWFAGSKVVGDDGKPITVYHGTTQDFERFDRSKGNPTSYFGNGFYFTDTANDANINYAGAGPDMTAKMQEETDRRANQIVNNRSYLKQVDEDGIHPDVRRDMMQHEGAVIPAYLAIKNPVVIDGPNSTRLSPKQTGDMIDGLKDIRLDFLNVDAERVAKDMAPWLKDNANADGFQKALRSSPGIMDAIDPKSGMEASNEIIRQMFQAAGFDGIEMKGVDKRWPMFEGLTPNTTHYIAFEPEQVKSVNNTGAFNPNDSRFMYSSAYRPAYSAAAEMGTRVPEMAPRDKLSEIEANVTYDNIAPLMAKVLRGYKGIGLSEEKARNISEKTIFNLQDVMQPLGKLIDRVKKNGGVISDEGDPYLRQQLMGGKIQFQTEEAKARVYDPLTKSIKDLNVSQKDVDELMRLHPSNTANIDGVPVEKSAVRNILSNYTDPKLALAEVYLYAQHAKERNALMRERNERLAGQRPDQYSSGSGMSDHEADQVLQWFGSKPFGNSFSDLGNPNSVRSRFRNLVSYTNDVRVDGRLNPDFRKMMDENGNPVDRYQDYAPLRGHLENDPNHQDEISNIFARTGKRLNIAGNEDKSALGRASQASHLIANAILQNEEAIYRAQKNKVGNSFLTMLRDNMGITFDNGPNKAQSHLSDFAEIIPLSEQKYSYDKNSGVVRSVNSPVARDPDVMIVKDGGKSTAIRIKDDRLRQAMLGNTMLGDQGMHAIINTLRNINAFLAAARTMYNPEFLMSNFFKDFGTAQINMTELEMKGLRSDVLKSVFPAIRGIWRTLRDSNVNDPWREVFDDFQKHGARTSYMGLRDLDNTIKRTLAEIQKDPGDNWQKAKDAIKPIADLVESSNEAVENGVRIATYKHVIDKLLSQSSKPNDPKEIERIKNRAAYIAKNLTVNFNAGGAQKHWINAMYLFYNASIQGTATIGNTLIRSQKARRMALGVVAGGLLQDALMSSLAPIAPDGQNEYDKIPEYILQTNMIFFNPMAENGYIKIPMPDLFNAVWNSGRATMRYLRGGYTAGQAMNTIVGTAADRLNPFGGGGSWLNYVAPSVLDPFVELAVNTDFSGKPIAPTKSPNSAVDLPAQRYWNNTSPIYTTTANLLDKLSGGDGVFKGAISYSPNQYEYAVNFIGGSAATTVVRAFDMLTPSGPVGSAIKGEEVSANDIPFVRRLVGNLTSKEDLQNYIQNRDRVMAVRDALKQATKDGDSEQYQNIIAQYPNEYRQAAKISSLENQRMKISSQIKKINGSKLPDDQKSELVKSLKKQQEALVNQGNLYMNAQ